MTTLTEAEVRFLRKITIAANLIGMVLYEGDVPQEVDGILSKLRIMEEELNGNARENAQN
jgi:hypothetical protein